MGERERNDAMRCVEALTRVPQRLILSVTVVAYTVSVSLRNRVYKIVATFVRPNKSRASANILNEITQERDKNK